MGTEQGRRRASGVGGGGGGDSDMGRGGLHKVEVVDL